MNCNGGKTKSAIQEYEHVSTDEPEIIYLLVRTSITESRAWPAGVYLEITDFSLSRSVKTFGMQQKRICHQSIYRCVHLKGKAKQTLTICKSLDPFHLFWIRRFSCKEDNAEFAVRDKQIAQADIMGSKEGWQSVKLLLNIPR